MRVRSNIILVILTIANITAGMAQGTVPVACAGSVVRYGTQGLPNSVFDWTVTGGTIVKSYNDSIDVLWGNKTGTYNIMVTEYSENKCSANPYLATVKVETPFVDIGDVVQVCDGDTQLIVVNSGFKSYHWNNGKTNNEYEASEPGVVWVEVVDQNNCINRDSVIVKVNPLPKVNLGDDQELCGDDLILLDAGEDGVYYRWSTGGTSQTITVGEGKQTYTVEVLDKNGCKQYDTLNVLACIPYEEFKKALPTAFTPNDDGVNDKFYIHNIEKYPNAEIEIFDRWGRRIFKSDIGYTQPWDGTFDGQKLPMDSYYYVIDLKEGLEPIAGSISIVK